MIRNYFKIALRNLVRHKLFSLINILGLAVGVTASLLIFLFVQDELRYDQSIPHRDRVYRLIESFKNGENYTTTCMTPIQLGGYVSEYVSGMDLSCRIGTGLNRLRVKRGEEMLEETGFSVAEPAFLDVFGLELLKGKKEEILREPFTVVLTESLAKKYFEDQNPIGKVLSIEDVSQESSFELTVDGIMQDPPPNLHLQWGALVSFPTGDSLRPGRLQAWGWTSMFTYVRLQEGADPAILATALPQIIQDHAPEWFQEWAYFGFQPVADIHLRSDLKDEPMPGGDIRYVYIFILIGVFILLIACINYMNLATARAASRAKEVGLRKVIGARRQHLILQFLGEAVIVSSLAFTLAALLTEWILPFFNQLAGKTLELSFLAQPALAMAFMGLALLIGLLAGSYPALYLSGFKPISILKRHMGKGDKSSVGLRKGLVVLQFTISISLIVGTLIIYQQWNFLKEKKLGIQTDQVVSIPMLSNQVVEAYPALKTEFQRIAGVSSVTASNKSVFDRFTGYSNLTIHGSDLTFTLPYQAIDQDFFSTFGVEVLAGRDFESYSADSGQAVILNEAACRLLGWERQQAIGRELKFNEEYGPRVVGVVPDFHLESLHQEIGPVYFYHTSQNFGIMSVRIQARQVSQSLTALQESWDSFGLQEDFSYTFLDEDLHNQYLAEERFLQVFTIFAGLAIFIACLGILGLAAFTAAQRTREIGIRKVLGASVSNIVILLSREFLLLVFLALLIAVPISWWAMQVWLNSFAYHIQLGLGAFLTGGVLSILIAFLVVGHQAMRAALINPVDALKED